MRTCKEVHRLVAEGLDRKLGFADRVSTRLHLVICNNCRRFTRQMKFLRAAMLGFPGSAGRP
jgi:hypothetical protein